MLVIKQLWRRFPGGRALFGHGRRKESQERADSVDIEAGDRRAGSFFSDTSVRARVLLLAILPLSVVCVFLGYYLTVTRLSDLEESLRMRGYELAEHLAVQTELGWSSNGSQDSQRLNSIAEITANRHDVHAVTIRDTQGRVLAHSKNAAVAPEQNEAGAGDEQLLTFSAPVTRSGPSVFDHDGQYDGPIGASNPAQDEILGWVELSLSKADTLAREQIIIRNVVLLIAGATLFSGLIAMFIGRGIVRPMTRLSRAVDALRMGNLDTRVPVTTGAEIGALENGFNHMAKTLQRTRADLEQEVEIVTNKLALLLESLPIAVYRARLGQPAETLYITPNAKKLTGFSPEDFLNNRSLWKERIHPEDVAGVLANVPSDSAKGTYEFEYRWKVADGDYKWFYDYLRVIENKKGKDNQVIGMLQDITEFKRISQELRNTIGMLENKNKELDAARQKALAASEEKARFLANMSHEIRTPLNAIIGYTSLLSKSSLDAEQYEFARTVSRASAQLLRVIDDILNFSRLESGTVQLDKTPFDLREAFEDVISMLSPEAQDKGLELVLLVDSDVPANLVGDPGRINQVLTNLVSNAIKFTETGGVNVEVSRLNDDGPETEIEVQVSDTGIGMSENVQEKIFTSFHQADLSISRRYGGTGLGLAIVDKLVAMWGGRIRVDSEIGKGSTFSFTFKCDRQARQGDRPARDQLIGRKFLLYDENPVAARAVRSMVLRWSGNVYQAKGQAQVETMMRAASASGANFEMVIIGYNLGTAADSETLEALVTRIRHDYRVPVLLLVNRERTVWLDRALSDPGLGVMIKPVRRDLLYRQICDLLGLVYERHRPVAASACARAKEFAGMRVLLAEDNDFNRALVTTVLESRGVAVTSVTHGDEAVALASQGRFDVVIMDIHLPGVDGVEAARRMRPTDGGERRPPIIALTADVLFDDPEKLADAGMDACLLKPLDENRLWQLLRTTRVSSKTAVAAADPVSRPAGGNRRPAADRALSEPRLTRLSDALLTKLIAELPQHRRRIDQALENGDQGALRKQVHELKGVAGYFGFSELSETIIDFEQEVEGHEFDSARIDAHLAAIDRQIDDLVGQLAVRA